MRSRISRRGFLKGAGAVAVLVAGGGVWRAYEQGVFHAGKGPAYKAWEDWRGAGAEADPLALVSAAILAANPHNTQPWLFRVTESQIELFADRGRNLGTIDPFLREMRIGLGCALENLLLAAGARGYAVALELEPRRSAPAPVARVTLTETEPVASRLFEAIPDRHTDRGPFDRQRPVLAEQLQALEELGNDLPELKVAWFVSPQERSRVGSLLVEATEAIIRDEEQAGASYRWFRHDWDDIQHYRDGLTLDTFGMPAPIRVAAKMLPPLPRRHFDQGWLDSTRDVQVATAATFGIITVADSRDDRLRLQGGRLWQRMHLWATTTGLAMQPMSQITERADREASLNLQPQFGAALRELTGDPQRDVLMVFRLGYPTEPAPASPRRSVPDVLLPGEG